MEDIEDYIALVEERLGVRREGRNLISELNKRRCEILAEQVISDEAGV